MSIKMHIFRQIFITMLYALFKKCLWKMTNYKFCYVYDFMENYHILSFKINPRFPPFLVCVLCKSGLTFIRKRRRCWYCLYWYHTNFQYLIPYQLPIHDIIPTSNTWYHTNFEYLIPYQLSIPDTIPTSHTWYHTNFPYLKPYQLSLPDTIPTSHNWNHTNFPYLILSYAYMSYLIFLFSVTSLSRLFHSYLD